MEHLLARVGRFRDRNLRNSRTKGKQDAQPRWTRIVPLYPSAVGSPLRRKDFYQYFCGLRIAAIGLIVRARLTAFEIEQRPQVAPVSRPAVLAASRPPAGMRV